MKDTSSQPSSPRKYTASDIQSLKWCEHVRLRPSMYVGALNMHGWTGLLLGLCRDFLTEGGVTEVTIEVRSQWYVIFNFCGKEDLMFPDLPDLMPQYHYFLPIICALSHATSMKGFDQADHLLRWSSYEKGELKEERDSDKIRGIRKLIIETEHDPEVWGTSFSLHADYLYQMVREFAFLNPLAQFEIIHDGSKMRYHFPGGLKDLLETEHLKSKYGLEMKWMKTYSWEEGEVELALALIPWTIDTSFTRSFVNAEETRFHGSHVEGVWEGIYAAFLRFAQAHSFDLAVVLDAPKALRSITNLLIHVVVPNPVFEGATKERFRDDELKKKLKDAVAKDYLIQLEAEAESALYRLRSLSYRE